MLVKIQRELIEQYEQLQNKSQLFDYYVSLQSPEKQRKLIDWWQHMIQAAVIKSGDIYLTPADLQIIFTIDGLKPVSLANILIQLEKNKKIEWNGRKVSKSGSSWMGTISRWIWRKQAGMNTDGAQQDNKTEQRIIPIEYKKKIEQQIIQVLRQELGDENSAEYQYLFGKLKKNLKINNKAIQFVISELEKQKRISISSVNNFRVLLLSTPQKVQDSGWVQLEKARFLLRSAIQNFDRKIDSRFKEQDKLLREAKQLLAGNDKSKAKKLIGQVKVSKKTTQQFENRRKLLRQTLDQLDLNEINSSTVDVMSSCQNIIQKTMVDSLQIQDVKDKHFRIVQMQKEFNKELQEMNNLTEEELSCEVNDLLKQLQGQIQLKKEKKNKPIQPTRIQAKVEQQLYE